MREWEVPHPSTVGRDAVADGKRQHEGADRRRRKNRLRKLGRLRAARRVDELVVADVELVLRARRVGCDDDQLDLGARQLSRDGGEIAEARFDRVRERVFVKPEQRQPPEPVGPERLVRLQREQELLQVREPVEGRERACQRSGGGPDDPADARPKRALLQALEEAELHQHAVDPAAGEDDCYVPLHVLILCVS